MNECIYVICVCVCARVYVYAYMYVYMCVCVCACMYVCIYVCMFSYFDPKRKYYVQLHRRWLFCPYILFEVT